LLDFDELSFYITIHKHLFFSIALLSKFSKLITIHLNNSFSIKTI